MKTAMLHRLQLLPVLLVSILLLAQPAAGNVVGADTQNFNPTNDGLDFVTVHSSKTLTPGLLNIGLFLNYAVNTLPNYEDKTTQTRTNFHDSLLSSDVNFGLGLTQNWEVGLSFPAVLAQNVTSDLNTYHGEFSATGLTEFRGMTKLRFWGGFDYGVAAVVSANFNQIENNPFLGSNAGPTYNFELAVDTALGKRYQWGLNGGYRVRSPGKQIPNVPIEPLTNQYIASTALSYLIPSWDSKLIAEIFGSAPAKSQRFVSDRQASTAEFLLGLKTDITASLAFHIGGGTELVHGASSPDWRVYTGLNWVIGPLFKKPRDVMVRVRAQPLTALNQIEQSDPYAGAPQVTESFIARDVLFEFNSDQLRPAAAETLQNLVNYLAKPPGFKTLTIEGHTDSIGSATYNVELSQRRANRVRQEVVKMGMAAEKVRAIGYGAARPIANNGNYQGRAMNRRVEFKVQR